MKIVDVPNQLVDFSKEAASYGYQLIKRFPLRKEFIRDEKYSKKFSFFSVHKKYMTIRDVDQIYDVLNFRKFSAYFYVTSGVLDISGK